MKRLAAIVCAALAFTPAHAVKMMYTCTAPTGRISIQDRPCDAAASSRSYATPSASGSGPSSPSAKSHAPRAMPRNVDFTVACRSLGEERSSVTDAIRSSGDERQTLRLQKQLLRIGQAECTARCKPC